MQEHDARILRGAAIPTAIVGVIAMIIAYAMRGTDGLIGAVLGTLLVISFFAISAFIVAVTAKKAPHLVLPAALLTYLVKTFVLGGLLIAFRGTAAFDADAMALATLACVVVWLGAHSVAGMKVRRLYVEPVEQDERDATAAQDGSAEVKR